MKVVVGLGNPGSRYAGTRHNVGFEVVDMIAAGPGTGPFRKKFEAQVAELKYGDEAVLLVKPETFMNLSGRSLRAAVDFYKVAPADVMVICDDMALPVGKLRIRGTGGNGGHNGLRNIEAQMGTVDYARLRLGVGARETAGVDHVLGKFKPGERPAVEQAVERAAEAVLVWVKDGITVCMNRYNGDADSEKKKKPSKETKRPSDADQSV